MFLTQMFVHFGNRVTSFPANDTSQLHFNLTTFTIEISTAREWKHLFALVTI